MSIYTSKETRTLTFKRKPIPKIGLATNYSILVLEGEIEIIYVLIFIT